MKRKAPAPAQKATSRKKKTAEEIKVPRGPSEVDCPYLEGEMNRDGWIPTPFCELTEKDLVDIRHRWEVHDTIEMFTNHIRFISV